ncbi:MAG: HPr family phosphocarrier protein [Oscillospiraceae bacterium]|nr:HPr family phosphocarrier protein [Oscillospiraceae bacterium]
MLQQTITVQIPCDRMNDAITQFIQKANSFSSRITIAFGKNNVNAKSLLGLLSMGLQQGAVLTLAADGADAEEALAVLSAILEQNI